MQRGVVVGFAIGLAVSACAPYPVPQNAPPPVAMRAAPIPLAAERARLDECALIRGEIVHQQRIAQASGVMATPLAQGAVLLNTYNVIYGLRQRAAIEGCPI